jgi:hypothetical protein
MSFENAFFSRGLMSRRGLNSIARSYSLRVLVNLIFFVEVTYVSFLRNRGHIFAGLDGSYILTLVKDQATWAPRALGFSVNPLQGLGDIWLALNTQLLPGYVIPVHIFGAAAIVDAKFHALSYTIFATELFLATVIFGRAVGFGGITSILGAWLAPLLLFPVIGAPRFYPLLGIAPNLATAISGMMLLSALFARLGATGSWSRDAVFVVLAVLVAGHLIVSQPLAIFLCAPILAVAFAGLAAGAETGREIVIKIAGLGLVALTLSTAGFPFFLLGIFKDTATSFWAQQFMRVGTTAYEISILFQTQAWGYTGVVLYCLALPGIVNCLFAADRRLSRYAGAVLCMIALLFGLGGLVFFFDVWRGPGSVYFEIMLVPIYALFAIHFVMVLMGRLMRYFAEADSKAIAWFRNPVVTGGALALLIVLVSAPNSTRYFPLPPAKTPLIATLGDLIAISPGAPFRGRVATFQAQDVQGKSGWLELHGLDSGRVAATGNDYHMVGMWFYQIPTLIEYSQVMSPAFFRAATYLLARPEDVQMRNGLVVRRIVPSILRLLGVRYVITDVLQPVPLRLIMSERTTSTETLHLYEVPDSNLGTRGTVELRRVASFDAALDAIAAPDFDPTRTAIVIASIQDIDVITENLVPVERASLEVVPGGLSVEASSRETSVLVLPFEFSHCLRVSVLPTTGSAVPRLLRVNALETGLVFAGSIRAEIRYFNGPFYNADCRMRDAAEFSRLIGR